MQDTIINLSSMKGRHFPNQNPQIKVVGVGNAGTNIIGDLFHRNLHAQLIAINTDWQLLSARHADEKFLIGLEKTKGLGCGGDPSVGAQAVRESMHDLKFIFDQTELMFFIGGLGNGTATGGLPELAKEAKRHGCTRVGLLVLPFEMNQREKDENQEALELLHDFLDTTIVLDFNHMLDVYKDIPLTQAYQVMNELIANTINAIISIIRDDEVLDVDFSHLKPLFQRGGIGTIGVCEMHRNDNLEKMVDKVVENKLFHFQPKLAESAVVYVEGDASMSLSQIHKAASGIKSYLAESPDVVLGIKVNPELNDHIRTTVIMTGVDLEDVKKKAYPQIQRAKISP